MNIKKNWHFYIYYLILLCLFISITSITAAPLFNLPNMISTPDLNKIDEIDLNGSKSKTSLTQTHNSFIDNSIDQDEYMIGMGDVFSVSIVELPSVHYIAVVNQNCDIYISELGLLKLGKISLKKARKEIASFVKKKIRSRRTIYVSLEEGKRASITINGCVSNPGTYFLDGILRIQDCILKANKGKMPKMDETNLRDVTVIQNDTTLHLDLVRFLKLNDYSQNPYVYPGDRVFIHSATSRVYIMGELMNPPEGFFSIKNGETLAELLPLISLKESADLSHIIVQRGASNKTRHTTIFSSENARNCILEDMDIISFSPRNNYPEHVTVTVSGAVKRPGIFPAIRSKSTAKDLLALAGGFRDNADKKRGYIIRKEKSFNTDNTDPSVPASFNKNSLNAPGSVRPEINVSFSRLSNFSDYTLISFTKVTDSLFLESGDDIFIPFTESYIYVSGCVNKPGAYLFKTNKKWKYYIKQAGGFSNKSDRSNSFILTRVNTTLQFRDTKKVYPGDIIVVPDSQNNKLFTTIILPFLQIVSTAATLLIAVNALK